MKQKMVLIALIAASLMLAGCGKTSDGPVVVATSDAVPSPSAVVAVPMVQQDDPGGENESGELEATVAPYPAPADVQSPESYPAPAVTRESEAYPAPVPTREIDAYPAPTEADSYPAPVERPTAMPTEIASGDLAALDVALELVVDGLAAPVGVTNAADGSGRLFVVEKGGTIRVVSDGRVELTPFLDIQERVNARGNEQGLLGVAFHPDYGDNGFFFVNYTDLDGNTVVSRFSVSVDPALADPASEMVVLTQQQPAENHNGGQLAFGPDGYLYVGLGDGGGAGDRFGNGQNGATWLGAMLRLDVTRGEPYVIPYDNPFVGSPEVRDEIWALGLRNPWRYSFDRLTGDLYIADVGQAKYEEVNLQLAASAGGENYGWPISEGGHCYPEDNDACDRSDFSLPVVEYDHSQGCSVTGGYVYRGSDHPSLNGVYLFGDYCTSRIWGVARGVDGNWLVQEMLQADFQLASFGEDEQGELYLVALDRGELYRLTVR